MRRDIGFYIEADVKTVYEAYLKAAMNKPFERDCRQEPYHAISFGVNYSFKYNMNGGSCNIHFMPHGTGTAVNMRFSIAQAFGAKYEKYAQDLNQAMRAFLPVNPRPATYVMDDFLRPQNQITPASYRQTAAPAPVAPVAPAAPVAPVAPAGAQFCSGCGNQIIPGSRFCSVCGKEVSANKTCPNCRATVPQNAAFCHACGTRL